MSCIAMHINVLQYIAEYSEKDAVLVCPDNTINFTTYIAVYLIVAEEYCTI
jgi:hypothetical protein